MNTDDGYLIPLALRKQMRTRIEKSKDTTLAMDLRTVLEAYELLEDKLRDYRVKDAQDAIT